MDEVRDLRSRAYVVAAIAGALAASGQHEQAAKLFGASEAEHERIAFTFVSHSWERQRALGLPEPWSGSGQPLGIHETLARVLAGQTAAIRAIQLDPGACQVWWAEGRRMPFESALALAQAARIAPEASAIPGGLTPREVEVVRLLARGYPDRRIAGILSISPRTVNNHVQHIFTKLDVGTRAAAAAWAIRHHLD
jgi:DNA-binding CsgD family transcriptional regulator